MFTVLSQWGFPHFTSMIRTVNNLLKTKVHGTADDNVHLAHSMHISKTLIENGIMFKQMVRIITTVINIVIIVVVVDLMEEIKLYDTDLS